MSTYSTRFFAGNYTGIGAAQTVYTVPAGNLVVLRDIEFFSTTADPFNVQAGAPGATHVIWLAHLATAGTWMQWEGRAVVDAGEVVTVFAGSTGAQFYISGYLLTSP